MIDFFFHATSKSASWGELRMLRPEVLTSEQSWAWYVPHSTSHHVRQYWRHLVLHICHFARYCFWGISENVKSQVCTSILDIKSICTSYLFLSTQSTNHWKVLSVRLTTHCPMLVPLQPKWFSVVTASVSWRVNISQVGWTLMIQTIGQTSEFLLSSPTDITLSVWTFQFSTRIKNDCGSALKIFTSFVICLFLGFVTWLHRHL